MQGNTTRRRSYGTGSLEKRQNADGSRSWVAVYRKNGRRMPKKTIGRVREGRGDGLTEKQANEKLAELRGEIVATPRARGEQMTIAELSRRYLLAPRRGGKARKESTSENVESETRVHLAPFFGDGSIDGITAEDVADLIATLRGKGLAAKSIRNIIGTLSALFNFALAPRRGWVTGNPCDGAELPALEEPDEIRFLTLPEVRQLIEHAPTGMFQSLDRAVWLTAAMTGLRKGELVALRWRDVDWAASRIRVRQNYVRGRFGSPKSRRSTRSVPMADEVGGVLDRLFQASGYQGDDDLVFAHPATGGPLTKPNMSRRFRKALKAAGLDETHVFHDLRHTFGTRIAAVGTPLRTLQEWLGHRDLATTQRYADYAPSSGEADLIAAAFTARGHRGDNLSESQMTSQTSEPVNSGDQTL